jgi:hypothetical protein
MQRASTTASDRGTKSLQAATSGLYGRDGSKPSNMKLMDAEWTSQPASDPRLPVPEIQLTAILGELRLQRGDDPAGVGFGETTVGWNEHHPRGGASTAHDQLRVQRP